MQIEYLGDLMIIKVKKSKNILKIKYKSNGKKHCEKIIDEKEFDIDENSNFTIIKYDTDFDTKEKIILYSLKMIFLSVFLMMVDYFGDMQDSKSFYYVNYRFKCVSDYVIDGNDLENEQFTKKRIAETLFNALYLILSFILFGLIILIIMIFVKNR